MSSVNEKCGEESRKGGYFYIKTLHQEQQITLAFQNSQFKKSGKKIIRLGNYPDQL